MRAISPPPATDVNKYLTKSEPLLDGLLFPFSQRFLALPVRRKSARTQLLEKLRDHQGSAGAVQVVPRGDDAITSQGLVTSRTSHGHLRVGQRNIRFLVALSARD